MQRPLSPRAGSPGWYLQDRPPRNDKRPVRSRLPALSQPRRRVVEPEDLSPQGEARGGRGPRLQAREVHPEHRNRGTPWYGPHGSRRAQGGGSLPEEARHGPPGHPSLRSRPSKRDHDGPGTTLELVYREGRRLGPRLEVESAPRPTRSRRPLPRGATVAPPNARC